MSYGPPPGQFGQPQQPPPQQYGQPPQQYGQPPYGQPPQQFGQPPYGQPSKLSPAPARAGWQPNLGVGVIAGLGAGIVGAIVWGGFTGLTHYRISWLSLGVGAFIGWAIAKAAGGRSKELGVAAGIITLLACCVGEIGMVYALAMHDLHASLSSLMHEAGPWTVLKDDLSDDKIGILFFVGAAVVGYIEASMGLGNRDRRRPVASNPATPGYGQPAFGQQPPYGNPAAPPPQPPVPPPPAGGYYPPPPPNGPAV